MPQETWLSFSSGGRADPRRPRMGRVAHWPPGSHPPAGTIRRAAGVQNAA